MWDMNHSYVAHESFIQEECLMMMFLNTQVCVRVCVCVCVCVSVPFFMHEYILHTNTHNDSQRWSYMNTFHTQTKPTVEMYSCMKKHSRDKERKRQREFTHKHSQLWWQYGVATTSRLLKIIGLFCKRVL